ncbi:hypothetical protein B0E46_02680 [Rhodanobacter sp. B04]|uniref:hypothetical protein n=1 Tax=Rhodanobacter sp. B04 TaxID=1945860 RepID=UPI000984831D|nr:hypothetical protein [Rhodanobacter sp. B04]OOG66389.1 hypothetical protein B0E46_02680 [Rhodanobacter sp. B04]
MSTYNPYEAPKADVSVPMIDEAGIDDVASAQKLIIYAILAYFAAVAIQASSMGPVGFLVALGALVLGLVGTYRLCASLGFSTGWRVILLVLMFVPLVNLIVLLVLNAKATARLRAAGFRVGLLGASR